jgi:hypothetical protein
MEDLIFDSETDELLIHGFSFYHETYQHIGASGCSPAASSSVHTSEINPKGTTRRGSTGRGYMNAFDETFDFVIVGSGGGSMCAALLLRQAGKGVVILEKTDKVGGSTARAGGVMWIPNNRFVGVFVCAAGHRDGLGRKR